MYSWADLKDWRFLDVLTNLEDWVPDTAQLGEPDRLGVIGVIWTWLPFGVCFFGNASHNHRDRVLGMHWDALDRYPCPHRQAFGLKK